MEVTVRDENSIEHALKALKRKLQREGVFREMKLRKNFVKPCIAKMLKKAEAIRRQRKLLRKRQEREGY